MPWDASTGADSCFVLMLVWQKASTECEGAKQKHGPDFGYLGLPRTNTENAANGLEGFELNTRHKLWKFGSIQFICIFLSV